MNDVVKERKKCWWCLKMRASIVEETFAESSRRSGSCEQIGSGPMPTSSLKVESRSGTGGASSLTLPS